MSGFDDAWLALREPVDHASRDAAVAERVRRHFASRASLTVVDLGCGTGSNLRALALSLPPRQHWHLIDGDADLLLAARRRLCDWADGSRPSVTGVVLEKGDRRIDVRFECADLTARDLTFADVGAELVTAAALFDLVSRDWLERLVDGLSDRKVPIYSVLNYDGVAHWHPADPLDARVVEAFNRHQRGDKGFGPALGPAAAGTLARLCQDRGHATWSGDSPWRLLPAHAELVAALTGGFARAAGEIDPALRDALAGWVEVHAAVDAVTIGHRDVFAHP
ncbi:MAG: class I SAM-dependent methyltransferase [Siculibacillus sp.]|nr:class I SAM-dependent methyltransferase [Siculibacillus sp.]